MGDQARKRGSRQWRRLSDAPDAKLFDAFPVARNGELKIHAVGAEAAIHGAVSPRPNETSSHAVASEAEATNPPLNHEESSRPPKKVTGNRPSKVKKSKAGISEQAS